MTGNNVAGATDDATSFRVYFDIGPGNTLGAGKSGNTNDYWNVTNNIVRGDSSPALIEVDWANPISPLPDDLIPEGIVTSNMSNNDTTGTDNFNQAKWTWGAPSVNANNIVL